MNRYSRYISLLRDSLAELDDWRSSFDRFDGSDGSREKSGVNDGAEIEELKSLLEGFVGKMKENYPFHHPSYAGQMLKPPHPAAWLAQTLAMTINPNNHSSDSGPPTSEMEKEVIGKLAGMIGYGDTYLGHLTTGGTIANVEALWIARELHPGKSIASTRNAHYTHSRMCSVIKAPHLVIPVDGRGNPDMEFLEQNADDIGTIVITLGTTGLGFVEPLDRLGPWAREKGIRIHADAAYGGFYKLLAGSDGIGASPWNVMSEADSIVIDPHKHGLQPYGCGSIIFKDPAVGQFYRHDSPYTYFTSADLHLGEISLECSRAGAAAAAVWLTLKLFPLTKKGLGSLLRSCRRAALELSSLIRQSDNYRLYVDPSLDIVSYFPMPPEPGKATGNRSGKATGKTSGMKKTSDVSSLSAAVLNRGMMDDDQPLWLSLCKVPSEHFTELHPDFEADTEMVDILRSVLMKPAHNSFVKMISERLEGLYLKVLREQENPVSHR